MAAPGHELMGASLDTRAAASISVGEELPEVRIPVTTRLVVATAIATRDFQDVHHDKDAAIERGSEHVFMNILTTNGFVGRYVTDWAGPETLLKKVSIRLGVPNYSGDEMRMSGRVLAVEGHDVEIEVIGRNSMGDHVTGTVTVELP